MINILDFFSIIIEIVIENISLFNLQNYETILKEIQNPELKLISNKIYFLFEISRRINSLVSIYYFTNYMIINNYLKFTIIFLNLIICYKMNLIF